MPAEPDHYSSATAVAVSAFQDDRKLRATGECSARTWATLVGSEYQLGDRLLYLQKPMMRGDDVEELQRSLGTLGFDAGRPDAIFGPDTNNALADFQRNAGLTVDSILGHETLAALRRIQGRAGENTVALVREREQRRQAAKEIDGCTVVIGDLGGQRALADLTARAVRRHGANVAVVEQPDESDHASAANEIKADVYIGFELSDLPTCRVAYFSVPGFESAGGSSLTRLLTDEIGETFADDTIRIDGQGMRLAVLRETRMPAVVVRVGPPEHVVEHRADWARAVNRAVQTWLTAPDDI